MRQRSVAILKRTVHDDFWGSPRDGGTLNFAETLKGYVAHGLTVDIFSSSEDEHSVREIRKGIRLHRLVVRKSTNDNPLLRDFAEGTEFTRVLREYIQFNDANFSCIHSHHWSSAIAITLGGSNQAIRHIHTPHLLAAEKAAFLRTKLPLCIELEEQKILRSADGIIAVSNSEMNSAIEHYELSPSKFRVIPNAIRSEFLQAGKRRNGASFHHRSSVKLVSVGRLTYQKGFDVLLKAIARVRTSGIDLQCQIVGGPYRDEQCEAELCSLISDLNLANAVALNGEMNTVALANCLEGSDIYVQSSRYESQGVALLEAMACGLPVIASRLPAIEENIANGENGLLVPVEDEYRLAEAIQYLASDPVTCAKMSYNNAHQLRVNSWDTVRSKTLQFLLES